MKAPHQSLRPMLVRFSADDIDACPEFRGNAPERADRIGIALSIAVAIAIAGVLP
jgi:hypothetical protein